MERVLDIGEVVRKTKISVSTLRKYVLLKKIPYKKCGRLVRFYDTEIDAWMNAHSFGLDTIAPALEKSPALREGDLFPADAEDSHAGY